MIMMHDEHRWNKVRQKTGQTSYDISGGWNLAPITAAAAGRQDKQAALLLPGNTSHHNIVKIQITKVIVILEEMEVPSNVIVIEEVDEEEGVEKVKVEIRAQQFVFRKQKLQGQNLNLKKIC